MIPLNRIGTPDDIPDLVITVAQHTLRQRQTIFRSAAISFEARRQVRRRSLMGDR
jgi:hypothetical protein